MRVLIIVQNLGEPGRSGVGRELARYHRQQAHPDVYRNMASSRGTSARSGG